MKIIGKIIRVIIALLTAAVIIVAGSFATVFFISKDEPSDIFIASYAFIAEKGEDGKVDLWFVRRAAEEDLENGDSIVYYDGAYKSANAMIGYDGRLIFFDSDNLESVVTVEDDAFVGKTVALWQQK